MNWLKRYFALDNEVNENTVIGTWLILCASFVGVIQRDPVIFAEFLAGGLACFGLSLKKQ